MPSKYQQWLILSVTAALAIAAGIYASLPAFEPQAMPQPEQLATAQFSDLAGQVRTLSDWKGQVILLNFWATWCAPCRDEIPALQSTRAALGPRGFEVVGIALDRPALARSFASDYKIDYPILIDDGRAMELMRVLGNRSQALPFTAVIGRDGRVSHTHLGLLTQDAMRRMAELELAR